MIRAGYPARGRVTKRGRQVTAGRLLSADVGVVLEGGTLAVLLPAGTAVPASAIYEVELPETTDLIVRAAMGRGGEPVTSRDLISRADCLAGPGTVRIGVLVHASSRLELRVAQSDGHRVVAGEAYVQCVVPADLHMVDPVPGHAD